MYICMYVCMYVWIKKNNDKVHDFISLAYKHVN